ncbi:MAG: aminodeoxychorismate/anthranilate synthase component II [Gammaproteobacteria bacterium]|nr:aminodeoxychorismate/anthranilate synthase component II [Gammaproteobacteria bacterium]
MILIIDNYDSFVYNIARYVSELGYAPTVIRNDAITLAEVQSMAPNKIILSPGPCDPLHAGICLEVIREFGEHIPILGICLGHQAIGQAYGGKVGRAGKPIHGKSTVITHDGAGIFQNLPNPLKGGRYHSLVVEEDALPDCLVVTARSPEGEIMALSHQTYPVFGVQFHPESIMTEQGDRLLRNFLNLPGLTQNTDLFVGFSI